MRVTKDLLSGLLFCAFGLGVALVAQNYHFGTMARVGSGFFPTVLGVILLGLGLAITIQAILNPDSSEPVGAFPVRPVFFISLAIIVFGILIEDAGLVAALIALIVIARLAGREGSLLELVCMVVVLSAVAIGIFVYALNVRLPLGPW